MTTPTPAKFIREVRQEIDKITWPSRKETLISTAMVMVMVAVASVFFIAVDALVGWIIRLIIGI